MMLSRMKRMALGGVGAVLGQAGTIAVPFTSNLLLSNTANFRNQFRSGTGNTRIVFNGDSTMRGVDTGAPIVNTQYPNAMPVQLAALFNANSIAAGANNWFGLSGTNLADYTSRDSRVAAGAGAVFGSNKYQGGTEIRFPGVASTFSFTPPDNVDSIEVYWVDQGATGRTQSYQIDAGGAVNLATSGVNAQVRATASTTLGAHTVNMAWVSGGTTLLEGINCYNSGRREVSCWNMGISGGVSANMIDDTGAPGQGRLQQLKNFTPSLIITSMGLVNDWRTSVAVATSQANMDTFANFVKNTLVGCDLIFLTPPYDNGTGTGNTINQGQYVAAMYAVAAKYNVPVIDIRKKWLSYNNAVTNGWQYNPTAAGITISAATWAAGVATYTSSAPNSLVTGAFACVTGVVSSGGVGNGYNVFGQVTVVDSTHFTMPIASNAGTYTSGGSVPATDNVHPTRLGYIDEATVIYNALRAVM